MSIGVLARTSHYTLNISTLYLWEEGSKNHKRSICFAMIAVLCYSFYLRSGIAGVAPVIYVCWNSVRIRVSNWLFIFHLHIYAGKIYLSAKLAFNIKFEIFYPILS